MEILVLKGTIRNPPHCARIDVWRYYIYILAQVGNQLQKLSSRVRKDNICLVDVSVRTSTGHADQQQNAGH
jgi:hypothetical protein